MSIAKSYTAHLVGLQCNIVTIEVDISNGLHSFSVVGLGDRSVEESKDRISAAIKNSGYTSPKQKNQKVIVSLAPADIRKEGPSFDLAMALTYLVAANELSMNSDHIIFLGELSLEGIIRKVNGVLPILSQAVNKGFKTAFIPKDNAQEGCLTRGIDIYGVSSLNEVIDHITGRKILYPNKYYDQEITRDKNENIIDMETIRGNEIAKRGLEIAAAGAHNIIMYGPPGTGKTMLAQSFCSILPALSYDHSIEVTSIYSAAKAFDGQLIKQPPFRAPHHTASYPAIVGGGSFPKPGEITLAHRGVLFLDELPEFDREVLEALRQPLEDHSITISRARGIVSFPAQTILIASMNPCPCGLGKDRGCICPEHIVNNYRRRISGPIMDRIDVWVNVAKVDYKKLSAQKVVCHNSETIRKRIELAREIQLNRFKNNHLNISYNSEMTSSNLEKFITMTDEARSVLSISAEKLELSGRAFHRVIKVAQTIADLVNEPIIKKEFILEALQYRQKKI